MDRLDQVIMNHSIPHKYLVVTGEDTFHWVDDIKEATVFKNVNESMDWCRKHNVDGKEYYLMSQEKQYQAMLEENAKAKEEKKKVREHKKALKVYGELREQVLKVFDGVSKKDEAITNTEKAIKHIFDEYQEK